MRTLLAAANWLAAISFAAKRPREAAAQRTPEMQNLKFGK